MSDERSLHLTTESITLGQLLKAVDVVSSGGEAKAVLSERAVLVNGVREVQRGRKLWPGDAVTLPDGSTVTVQSRGANGAG